MLKTSIFYLSFVFYGWPKKKFQIRNGKELLIRIGWRRVVSTVDGGVNKIMLAGVSDRASQWCRGLGIGNSRARAVTVCRGPYLTPCARCGMRQKKLSVGLLTDREREACFSVVEWEDCRFPEMIVAATLAVGQWAGITVGVQGIDVGCRGNQVRCQLPINTYWTIFSPILRALIRVFWLSLCTSWSSQPSPRSHSHVKKQTSRPSNISP